MGTLEERPAVTSARVRGVIPASCPPKRRSLIQENMNEEVMKEDIKKGPMKEKLLVPEFEGRDKSERNANVEQRLDRGLRKQPQKKEGGFQKKMPLEKNSFEQERKGIKGTTREANDDCYEKAREQEEVIQVRKEEEQKR